MIYFSYINNVKKILMNTNNKLNKANSYRLSQELLRNKALKKGVNLIAPETIFLSKDTSFGKNVVVEPYVVFGPKVNIGDNSVIKSFTHIEGTKIEKNVIVGPYARLRSGTILKKPKKPRQRKSKPRSLVDSTKDLLKPANAYLPHFNLFLGQATSMKRRKSSY